MATVIRPAVPADVPALADVLADVLVDCVRAGASVGFMWPLARSTAEEFWTGNLESAGRGERVVLVAEVNGRVVGTVQVVWAVPENQPHRGDVAKLLVHLSARGTGLGDALMRAIESEARAAGRTLLVLDTASQAAERIYQRTGWQRVGLIPDFALWPVGGTTATTVYYRDLADEGAANP